jgi:glycosyltransferase involved in cell wall biosynthesis
MRDNLFANGVTIDRITLIPNGVELPLKTAPVDRNSTFLYIGNFSQSAAHKGFDILIKAWAEVVRHRPNARLIMLGGGDTSPWKKMAQDLNCRDAVEFKGYQVDIQPFLESACCLVLPSRKEGISNALLEAQSWGIPAIVSDIPGNTEIISHGENGMVIPVGDFSMLADSILLLLDSPKLRCKMGKAARQLIESGFSMEGVSQRTVNLYEKLLGI